MKKILLLIAFLTSHSAFADEANIFCSTESGKWKWLYESSSLLKKVKVEGEFIDNLEQYSILKKYFTYFKISSNQSEVDNFSLQCINSYGKEYKYAQVSKGLTSDWYLIGISNFNISPGHYRVYYMLGSAADSMEVEKLFTAKPISLEIIFQSQNR